MQRVQWRILCPPQRKTIHPLPLPRRRQQCQRYLGSFSKLRNSRVGHFPRSLRRKSPHTSQQTVFMWMLIHSYGGKQMNASSPIQQKLHNNTSVSQEPLLRVKRIFSSAEDIVSAKRSRLAAENVDRLIFLQKNLKIQEQIADLSEIALYILNEGYCTGVLLSLIKMVYVY